MIIPNWDQSSPILGDTQVHYLLEMSTRGEVLATSRKDCFGSCGDVPWEQFELIGGHEWKVLEENMREDIKRELDFG